MARRLAPVDDRERHVRREGLTMALYVSITLLAALTLAAGEDTADSDVLAIVWGTTVGLALAHWFAFSLAVRLLDPMADDSGVKQQLVAQLSAAAVVAVVASVPVLLLPNDLERLGARAAAAGCIGYVGLLALVDHLLANPRPHRLRRKPGHLHQVGQPLHFFHQRRRDLRLYQLLHPCG